MIGSPVVVREPTGAEKQREEEEQSKVCVWVFEHSNTYFAFKNRIMANEQ